MRLGVTGALEQFQMKPDVMVKSRIRQRRGNLLTVQAVSRLHTPGKYLDGNGLWLVVDAPNRRYWHYRYQSEGRQRTISFGSADLVSLAQAREVHLEARKLVARGVDPLDARRTGETIRADVTVKRETFAFAAEEYLAAHEAGWKHPKHRQQWRNTLATTYAAIGDVPIGRIDTSDVLKVLKPIWQVKPETASRLRARIAAVIDYAAVRGWRERTPNPAAWTGHLEHVLAPKGKLRPTVSHPALPWREAPTFMAKLQEQPGIGALALQFAILTASRPGEVIGARWDEIDLIDGIWTVPAKRMKAGREHRVPLSRPALMILLKLAAIRDGSGLIFFARQRGKLLSDMTLTAVVRRMGRDDITVHGFRATFRTWSTDTGQDDLATEVAMAHTVGSKTRAAYERSDRFDLRRTLMNAWAAFLSLPPADVVPLRPGARKALHGPQVLDAAGMVRPRRRRPCRRPGGRRSGGPGGGCRGKPRPVRAGPRLR
jgi:integrase